MMNTTVKTLALKHVHELREVQRRHDDEAERYAREGYRPRTCIHGTYMWSDYDSVCGPCEDGYSRYEGQVLYELALAMAHSDYRKLEKRVGMVITFIEDAKHMHSPIPDALRDALVDWSLNNL